MKTINMIIVLISLTIGINANAQDKNQTSNLKTESFRVAGSCGMCKTRIEKAAKVEGVSKAEWNSEKQLLTVTYNPEKIKIEDIQKKIAAVGHDTDKFKAEDKVYDKLPGCCKYERLK